ncbi:MAG TPA: hypothetical protein VIM73_05860 [Polyangiaceae bacterium]
MALSYVLLQIAAWLHLCQVPGTWYLARHLIGISAELKLLSRLVSAVVVVLGIAVVLVLVGLGALMALHPRDVLGTRFGVALCASLGVFWLARLGVQFYYYFGLPWPRSKRGRLAHTALASIFATQSAGYFGVWMLAR